MSKSPRFKVEDSQKRGTNGSLTLTLTCGGRREEGDVNGLWYLSTYRQRVVGMSFHSNLYKIGNIIEATTAAIILIIDA